MLRAGAKAVGVLVSGLMVVGGASNSGAGPQVEQQQPDRWSSLPVCSGAAGVSIATGLRTLPAVGNENEVEVGGTIVDATPILISAGSLELKSPVRFNGRFMFTDFEVKIPAGSVQTDASGRFRPGAYEVKYASEPRPRTGSGRPEIQLEVEPGGRNLVGALVPAGGRRFPIEGAEFTISECYLTTAALARRQLIYTGVSRGVISIEYRELSGNMMRPAFAQTLNFDLSEGDTIGVQGARLKVVSANNLGLRYVILKPFAE